MDTLSTTIATLALATLATLACAQQMPGKNPPSSPLPPAPMPGKQSADNLVKITSTADVPHVTPGEKFNLAFVFDIEPHWHIYWKNSGASGGPTSVQIHGPQAFAVGEPLYPRPTSFSDEEGVSYGYQGKVVIYVPVTAPTQLAAGSVTFTARINFMVCKDVCLLGRSMQMVSVLTFAAPPAKPSPLQPTIDPVIKDFKSRLPQPLKDLSDAEAKYDSGVLTITLPAQGFSTAQFFPMETPGVTYDQATVKKRDDQLTITVSVATNFNNAMGAPMKILGTVGLGTSPTNPCYDVEIPLPAK